MNEPVKKLSEQSVVSRALVLRAKLASDDLYKQYVFSSEEYENQLSTQAMDFKGGDWTDWDKGRR